MSGTALEEISSSKVFGGNLVKYKFKVCLPFVSLALCLQAGSAVGSSWRSRCAFQSILACKRYKLKGPSPFLPGWFDLHGG